MGIDLRHFANFAVPNLMIGLPMPPVDVCLVVGADFVRLPLAPVVVAILPFLATDILVLLAVSCFAPLATWLPSVLTQ